MADRALTEEAMLAGLRDIRLPSEAAGGLLGELLTALALGLLLAALLGCAARWVTSARTSDRRRAAALADLPEEDQRLALLHRLKTAAPARYAEIAARLYQPGGLPDLDTLRAEVDRHA
ncbi:hypothetical protein ACOXXX_12235 [Thalassococcus sp. BH17M4-6]|uniref:hypothetical protein n=1 Tax=Thalassococcus sp. BH17M4-6 TaxID=3413148 RepID=UPI003BBCD611